MNVIRLPFLLCVLACLLALPASATLDRNADGISDVWAGLHPSAGAPTADPDGDGASNRAEAQAGTDPSSASSRLAATTERDASGNLVLRWPSVTGKHYQIESSTDLANWAASPLLRPGTGADLSEIVGPAGVAAPGRQFWRVAVADTDTDSDGLNDWEEAQLGTSSASADTDSDGRTDSWEAANGTDPTAAAGAPTITIHPGDAVVTVGQTATFTATANGDGPLSYQWSKDGTPISGAKSTSYTTPTTVLSESGTLYGVIVSDTYGGHIGSTTAHLTVNAGAHRSQHYVDPVNGSDLGDGSSTSPWKSLQTVVTKRVATRNWASLPYADGRSLIPVNPGAAVQAGDTIWLRSGVYGTLTIQGAYNYAPITIAAEAGNEPRFSTVVVQAAQNWILRDLTVSPSFTEPYRGGGTTTIVAVNNHGYLGPTYDITIDGFEIYSVPDEIVWPLETDWETQAANAIAATGARVAVRNCRIRNVRGGIMMSARGSRVEDNSIDGFCGDGMNGNGDDGVFEYNLVKNLRRVNENHADAFQSWSNGAKDSARPGVVTNMVVRGNVLIAYDARRLPFTDVFQGIGCFGGAFAGWIVENNVVITNTPHGIAFYGARNVRIVNNTVVDLDPTDVLTPWILVAARPNGEPSMNCVVRNNLTSYLNMTANAPNGIVVDHNIVLPKDAAGYFVDLAHRNVHLAAGSPAIDEGSATLAPAFDADEAPRPTGAAIDVGAYEYEP